MKNTIQRIRLIVQITKYELHCIRVSDSVKRPITIIRAICNKIHNYSSVHHYCPRNHCRHHTYSQ